MIDILKEIFNNHKYGIFGFITGTLLILFTIIISLDEFLGKGIKSFTTRCIIYTGIIIIWFIIWLILKNYYPKNKKNKIGIIVSITTENDKQKIRIKNDFIKGMLDIAKRNNLNNIINFINLEDFKATKANEILNNYASTYSECLKSNNLSKLNNLKEIKILNKFVNKTKGQIYIYGSIKERQDQENKYFININAHVRHKPIDIKLSNEMSKEFQAILPKEISFFEKLEFRGFEFASDVVFIAVRYMIGVAAMVSFDPFTAYTIHNGLLSELNKFNPQPPNIKHISNKLTLLLTEELLQQSKYFLFNKNDSITTKRLLEQAESINNTNYHVYIFRSFYSFVIDNNTNDSINYCKLAKNYANGNGTWLYNLAFIHMYLEQFEEGYKEYKKIKETVFLDEEFTINECIEFNENYFKKNPTFFQSLFILGYLYFFKKNNYPIALEKFELFNNLTNNNLKFNYLQQKVISFLSEIKKEMKIE